MPEFFIVERSVNCISIYYQTPYVRIVFISETQLMLFELAGNYDINIQEYKIVYL